MNVIWRCHFEQIYTGTGPGDYNSDIVEPHAGGIHSENSFEEQKCHPEEPQAT